jgi:hypothetical protein
VILCYRQREWNVTILNIDIIRVSEFNNSDRTVTIWITFSVFVGWHNNDCVLYSSPSQSINHDLLSVGLMIIVLCFLSLFWYSSIEK